MSTEGSEPTTRSSDSGGTSPSPDQGAVDGTGSISGRAHIRWLWIAAGWVALALGTLGIFLPVLPTTPLVLLAAWCFSRGSERMHRWLLDHRQFGPMVRDWERYGVISLRAKLLSTSIMVLLVGYMVFFSDAPAWSVALAVPLVLFGLVFVWSKPSEPEAKTDRDAGAPQDWSAVQGCRGDN